MKKDSREQYTVGVRITLLLRLQAKISSLQVLVLSLTLFPLMERLPVTKGRRTRKIRNNVPKTKTSIRRSFWIETHVLFGTRLHGIHFSGFHGSRRRVSATVVQEQCGRWCGSSSRQRHASLGPSNRLDDSSTLGKGGHEARGGRFQEHDGGQMRDE
jgi:hypothetical protein